MIMGTSLLPPLLSVGPILGGCRSFTRFIQPALSSVLPDLSGLLYNFFIRLLIVGFPLCHAGSIRFEIFVCLLPQCIHVPGPLPGTQDFQLFPLRSDSP